MDEFKEKMEKLEIERKELISALIAVSSGKKFPIGLSIKGEEDFLILVDDDFAKDLIRVRLTSKNLEIFTMIKGLEKGNKNG